MPGLILLLVEGDQLAAQHLHPQGSCLPFALGCGAARRDALIFSLTVEESRCLSVSTTRRIIGSGFVLELRRDKSFYDRDLPLKEQARVLCVSVCVRKHPPKTHIHTYTHKKLNGSPIISEKF